MTDVTQTIALAAEHGRKGWWVEISQRWVRSRWEQLEEEKRKQ